jgi:hypothetical protein
VEGNIISRLKGLLGEKARIQLQGVGEVTCTIQSITPPAAPIDDFQRAITLSTFAVLLGPRDDGGVLLVMAKDGRLSKTMVVAGDQICFSFP